MKRLLAFLLPLLVLGTTWAQDPTCNQWRMSNTNGDSGWVDDPHAATDAWEAQCKGSGATSCADQVCTSGIGGTHPREYTAQLTTSGWPSYYTRQESVNCANGEPVYTTITGHATRDDPIGCPVCPPVGTMRIVGWAAGAGEVCINECSYSAPTNPLVVTASGADHPLRMARSNGRPCQGDTSNPPPAESDGDCMHVDGIGTVCAEPESNCGSVNGDTVCPSQTQNGCVSFRSGAVACVASTVGGPSATPPGPDNGTPGTPATPDVQVTVNNSTTTNYYTSTTVGGSSAAPTTGAPTGGDPVGGSGGGGTCSGDECGEGEGTVSGGLSCTAAPVCEGDALECAAIQQQWRIRCVDSPTDEDLEGQFGAQSGEGDSLLLPDQTIEVPSAFSALGVISSDCPADYPLVLGGFLPTVNIPFSQWCIWLQAIGAMVMVTAYLGGLRIVGSVL